MTLYAINCLKETSLVTFSNSSKSADQTVPRIVEYWAHQELRVAPFSGSVADLEQGEVTIERKELPSLGFFLIEWSTWPSGMSQGGTTLGENREMFLNALLLKYNPI